jgi:predicted YcjX-like family ATPase
VTLFGELGRGLQRLAVGEVPFISPSVIRVGVTGLSRAGKTAFLTSVAANLMARRFALAPCRASTRHGIWRAWPATLRPGRNARTPPRCWR